MTQIKKFAWYGSSVAFAALLAVALLVAQPVKTASADVSAVSVTSNNYAAAATATWTTSFTLGGGGALADGGTVSVTFPSGFNVANVTAAATLGGAFANCSGAAAAAGQVVTVTLSHDGGVCALANSATGTIALANITNPGAGRYAGSAFTVATSVETTAVAATIPAFILRSVTPGFTVLQGTGTQSDATSFGGGTQVDVFIDQGAESSVSVSTTAGSFPQTGSTTSIFANNDTTNDLITDAQAANNNLVQIAFTLPASGTATLTISRGANSQQVTLTATSQAPASVSITRTPTSVPAAGGASNQSNIRVNVRNAAGANIAAPVTVTTNLGVLEQNASSVCDLSNHSAGATAANAKASCTYTSTTTANADQLALYGNGAAGTATITVTAGSAALGFVTATTTVSLTGGVVSEIELLTLRGNAATSTGTIAKSIFRHTHHATTGEDELIVVVRAKDANGNVINPGAGNTVRLRILDANGNPLNDLWATTAEASGLTISGTGTPACNSSVGGATCVSTFVADAGGWAGTGTDAHPGAVGYLNVTATQTVARGEYTIEAVYNVGQTTEKTATKTVRASGPADTVTVSSDVATVGVGDSALITANIVDEDGNPIADGTTVTWSASTGLFQMVSATTGATLTTSTTTNGSTTVRALALAQGQGQIFAIAGAKTGSVSVTIGTATAPAPTGDGQFAAAPTFGTGNVGAAVFNGGTIAELAAAVTAAGGIGVWTQDASGVWRSYLVAGPGVVNTGFNAAFAAGFAGPTAVFVVR